MKGNLDVIKYVYDYQIHHNGDYPIDLASRFGYLDIIEFLCSRNRCSANGMNKAIESASKYGHAEVVKFLCSQSCVNVFSNNGYAIRYASLRGHLEVVEYLWNGSVKNGSVKNGCAKNGSVINECIRHACMSGHLSVAEYLIKQQGADPASGCSMWDISAIEYAYRNKHFDIVSMLCLHVKISYSTMIKYQVMMMLDRILKSLGFHW